VVHAFWADPAGLSAVIVGRRLGVPVIVTCDSGEFTALPEVGYGLQCGWRSRAAVGLACRLASEVHVTTRFMETLARQYGCSPKRIPIGVDTTAIAPPSNRPEGPPWQLLQVASLNRVKDHSTLLEAVAIVRRQLDVQLDLAGEDTLGGTLQDKARMLGLSEVVRFHGFVPHDQIAPLRERAHLYVQSSRHEAAGKAVLEAAAAGLPVVGTRVGYISDWAGRAAEAVAPGNPDALAEAIEWLLRSAATRTALAREAYQFATEHDVRWTAEQFGRMYEAIARRDLAR
jgi:glycosyltransferase involved in cell wall biosynthesis